MAVAYIYIYIYILDAMKGKSAEFGLGQPYPVRSLFGTHREGVVPLQVLGVSASLVSHMNGLALSRIWFASGHCPTGEL